MSNEHSLYHSNAHNAQYINAHNAHNAYHSNAHPLRVLVLSGFVYHLRNMSFLNTGYLVKHFLNF